MLRAQAEPLQQLAGGAGVTKLVVDPNPPHRGGALLTEQGAYRLAQTANDAVLLTGNDLSDRKSTRLNSSHDN